MVGGIKGWSTAFWVMLILILLVSRSSEYMTPFWFEMTSELLSVGVATLLSPVSIFNVAPMSTSTNPAVLWARLVKLAVILGILRVNLLLMLLAKSILGFPRLVPNQSVMCR